jgi:hypothetical protein
MVSFHAAHDILAVRFRHEVLRIEARGGDIAGAPVDLERTPVFVTEGTEVLDVVR